MRHLPTHVPAAALGIVAALTAAGCAGSAPPPGADVAAPVETGTDPSSALTLDNCGTSLTVVAPPQRVVAVKSSVVELLLALELEDRVVGAAFLDGPVPDQFTASAASLDVIADAAPGREAVLALEPDMVLAGWESVFSADGAGARAALHDLGVLTYVAPAACRDPEHMPRPLTFDAVFDQIREVGAIFGVEHRADALVAEQQAELADVAVDDRDLTALWYSSGVDVPYVGAGLGAPQMMMEAVGLANIAGHVEDTWTSYGWEEVVDADPDVIVLVDATWNSAEQKIAVLEENPATSLLTAVRESRYLVVPFAATEAGTRNVSATASLAEQLAEIEVAP